MLQGWLQRSAIPVLMLRLMGSSHSLPGKGEITNRCYAISLAGLCSMVHGHDSG